MLYTISSENRTSGSTTNFNLALPIGIHNVNCITLHEVQLPNTIYNVTSLNNTVYVDESGTTKTCPITAGSYSITNLCSAVQASLIANASLGYTVTYSSISMKITIANSLHTFALLFSNLGTLATELGFDNSNTSTGNTFTGSNIISLYNPINLFIFVNEIGSHVQTSAGTQFTFKVSLDVNPGNLNTFTSLKFYPQKVHFGNPRSFQQFNISLCNESGLVIDTNGINWNVTLEFA